MRFFSALLVLGFFILFLYQQPLQQQWWLRFNDAKLNELVETVLQNNYDLKQAAYRVDQAKAAMRVAQGGFYPTINVNAGYNYNQNVTVPGNISQIGSLGVDAKWEIINVLFDGMFCISLDRSWLGDNKL